MRSTCHIVNMTPSFVATDRPRLRREMRCIYDGRSDSHVAHVRITHVVHVRVYHVAHVRVYHVAHVRVSHVAHVSDTIPAGSADQVSPQYSLLQIKQVMRNQARIN